MQSLSQSFSFLDFNNDREINHLNEGQADNIGDGWNANHVLNIDEHLRELGGNDDDVVNAANFVLLNVNGQSNHKKGFMLFFGKF